MAKRTKTQTKDGGKASTDGQRNYDDVASLVKQLDNLLDDIPRCMLGDKKASPDTCLELSEAIRPLTTAVILLRAVRKREVQRFEEAGSPEPSQEVANG